MAQSCREELSAALREGERDLSEPSGLEEGFSKHSKQSYLMAVQGCVGVTVVKQKHADEVDEDAGGLLGCVGIVPTPLEDDHENQVSKQTQHKNHLGDELQNDVVGPSEVTRGGNHTETER